MQNRCAIDRLFGVAAARFFHAGVIGTIADSTGGYAAFNLMGPDEEVLMVEYRPNLMPSTSGELLIARGQVLCPGRRPAVTHAEVAVVKGGREKPCAAMRQTMMRIVGRADVID